MDSFFLASNKLLPLLPYFYNLWILHLNNQNNMYTNNFIKLINRINKKYMAKFDFLIKFLLLTLEPQFKK